MDIGLKHDISPSQNGGVLKEILQQAPDKEDKPWKGDRVIVHYTGMLEDGTKFDSSIDRGEKFSFLLGKKEVIRGWDIAVASMSKGERAIFTISSENGYGSIGNPPKIPANANLIFEIELFGFDGEDVSKERDRGIIKRIIEAGVGLDHPNDGGLVTIDLIGTQKKDKTIFDQREDLTFVLGEGTELSIPTGVEIALEKMQKNEKAHISLSPKYGFGDLGCPKLGIPKAEESIPNKLTYEISLKSFERSKDMWQLDGEQKIEQAKIQKDKGTLFFKAGKIDLASTKYAKIIELLEDEHYEALEGVKEDERQSLLQAGRLNLAMCHLKQDKWIEARDLCDKVLEQTSDVAKAYFRRGESQFNLNELELAMKDFSKVLTLEPDNKAAKNRLTICQRQLKVQHDKEKKAFSRMF